MDFPVFVPARVFAEDLWVTDHASTVTGRIACRLFPAGAKLSEVGSVGCPIVMVQVADLAKALPW